MWNTDFSIMRTFPIKKRLTLQFRAEANNLPNTSHFTGAATANGFGNGGGGVDSGVTDRHLHAGDQLVRREEHTFRTSLTVVMF